MPEDPLPRSARGVYGISVASELSGIDPQTLRLYERRGLLTPARTVQDRVQFLLALHDRLRADLERRGRVAWAEEEMHAFILHPPTVRLPVAALTHPRQLYPHFLAYGETATAGAEPLAAESPACAAR